MNRRDVERMLAEQGLQLVELTKNRHWRARVRRYDGSEAVTFFPCSPSDHRALKNKRAALRALANGA